jgi:hypothetical protein
MSDFYKQVAALRGVPPPPPRKHVRPLELPEPTDVLEKRSSQRSEADMCDKLGDWLRRQGYEVFFEVPLDDYRPDVVGFEGDLTLAIEAKRKDVFGVIKQGLRIARRVDIAYVALPLGAADAVVAELAGYELKVAARADGRRPSAMPGVLVVGPANVEELRPPSGAPYRKIKTAELRENAERFGAERGGVPSTDQTERNAAMWRRLAAGEPLPALAEEYRLTDIAARVVIKRLEAWREHLLLCNGYPCVARRQTDRDFYAIGHRHAEAIKSLPARRA